MQKFTRTRLHPTAVVSAIVLLLFALLSVFSVNQGFCDAPKTVAVFPFEMNSSQDLTFLQKGLVSMLSSRLSDAGKVEILGRETIDQALADAKAQGLVKDSFTEAAAREIGKDLGVDYVLFGSLTHFGESVSLDASMVDVTGQQETLTFFEQSNSMGDVIPLVNTFAGDINMKVFNRNIDNRLYAAPQKKTTTSGGLQPVGGAGLHGGGMMAMQAAQSFSTHLKVDDVIRAMAIGDLNKDGRTQVVTATDSALQIYHYDSGLLTLEENITYQSYLRIIGLDVADINGNGYPEIFVTAMTINRETLSSFVVEYNGSSYASLVDGLSYYFRIIDSGDGTPVLYAQDKGRGPFAGKIYIMNPAGNGYEESKKVRMPKGTCVLSLARGAVREDAANDFLSINQHNRLILISDTGKDEWESTDKYGKTNNYWLLDASGGNDGYQERAYLNPRIKFSTMGGEKKNKAFIVTNTEAGGGSIGRIMRFKEGRIGVMSWNGIAMAPVFETMPLQGWISDFDIADIDNDGKKELVISVVSGSKLAIIAKDKASNIISYKLE